MSQHFGNLTLKSKCRENHTLIENNILIKQYITHIFTHNFVQIICDIYKFNWSYNDYNQNIDLKNCKNVIIRVLHFCFVNQLNVDRLIMQIEGLYLIKNGQVIASQPTNQSKKPDLQLIKRNTIISQKLTFNRAKIRKRFSITCQRKLFCNAYNFISILKYVCTFYEINSSVGNRTISDVRFSPEVKVSWLQYFFKFNL